MRIAILFQVNYYLAYIDLDTQQVKTRWADAYLQDAIEDYKTQYALEDWSFELGDDYIVPHEGLSPEDKKALTDGVLTYQRNILMN